MFKICQTLLMTIILHLTFKKKTANVYDNIKCLNELVIKWTDKINHLGYIILSVWF